MPAATASSRRRPMPVTPSRCSFRRTNVSRRMARGFASRRSVHRSTRTVGWGRETAPMNKTVNQKAWLFVLPVALLVAFSAIIPLMTVVNYSVQESFGENTFFWSGVQWFEEVLHSDRFHSSLLRQILFTAVILAIEVPLGLVIALAMPRKGPWVSVCLVLMALPLLIPWNVVGAMWNIMALPDIGLLGRGLNALGWEYNYT